jgi:hypothetical protein
MRMRRRGAPHRMPLGLHQWLLHRADKARQLDLCLWPPVRRRCARHSGRRQRLCAKP